MYEDFDSDVLAVLVRGDVKIIFVNTPDTGIDGKDFSVISWTSENLTIAVSDRYLNREIDNFITDGISKMLGDNVSDDEMAQVVREHAILLFSEKLTMLSEEAISSVHNPLELSLDYTLTQLLSGTTD
jgi:hypothetical protein|tara:strand:- start:283 stop:666 length:384 start_codon:yes stop_codon:yes gene_type:complete